MLDFVTLCETVMLALTLGVSGMGILFVSLSVVDALKLREVVVLGVSEALTEGVRLWDRLRLCDSLYVSDLLRLLE